MPNSVNVYNTPTEAFTFSTPTGFYAQDTWTLKRLTISRASARLFEPRAEGGLPRCRPLRAGAAAGQVPDQPNWKNVSPRIGGGYDLFGDARTALKGSVSKGTWLPWAGGWAKGYDPFTPSATCETGAI